MGLSDGDLGAHLDAEKDTQAQFHEATQHLLDTVPEEIRSRIERAAGGGLDHEAIRAKNSEDPTHSFATTEIGNALRDQYQSDTTQRGIRRWAERGGVDPALADRIADQAVGARAVGDLGAVFRREPIDPAKARALQQLGLLEQHSTPDGALRHTVTDDALPLLPEGMQRAAAIHPKRLPISHTKGPPANGLNRLVDGGRQRFAETARAIQSPSAGPALHKSPQLTPSTILRQINLHAAGFQEHHIISTKNSATNNHPLLKLAGFNLQSQSNKMWLPTDPALHPTRSIHDGKHFRRVSDNLAFEMDKAVKSGKINGWTQSDYAKSLQLIVSEERKLLKSGKRALNKNARPYAQ